MSSAARKSARAPARKVSRTYRLTLSKISRAREALGAETATETIERALDLVVLGRQLVDGTRAMLGVRITPPDADR